MMKKWQVFRDDAWTVLSFPKRGRSILWNDTTKTYEFYEGTPWEQEKKKELLKKEFDQTVKSNNKQVNLWRKVALYTTSAFGITLAVLLFVLLGMN